MDERLEMTEKNSNGTVDSLKIKEFIDKNKSKIKLSLGICARCSLCAESCFLFNAHNKDPKYMPSHKLINSLGYLYKRKGKVSIEDLHKIKEIVWERCVLCTRCYCPIGIDIPSLISLTRQICRSQDVYLEYDQK